MKQIEIYESPVKERNEEKYGTSDTSCVCCAKPMVNPTNFIHATTSWVAVNEKDEANVVDSQGFFPVGNECKKHFPTEFIFQFD